MFLMRILKGTLIGAGAILPGISSGVFCVIFGIYEKLVDSILHFFQKPKENFLFLLPILIGVGIGVIVLAKFLLFFFEYYPMPTKYTFIGLILGSIPFLFKEANKKTYCIEDSFIRKEKKKSHRLFCFLCLLSSFTLTAFMVYLENHFSSSCLNMTSHFSFSYLVLCGICMAAGIVIPRY